MKQKSHTLLEQEELEKVTIDSILSAKRRFNACLTTKNLLKLMKDWQVCMVHLTKNLNALSN